jgi:polysaccharide deacetylase family protein (PEP-CTERM system associated)
MSPPITFTMDLEDLRPSEHLEARVEKVSHGLLDWLARENIRGTIFVVGDVAEAYPSLVARAAEEGHEIGLHAHLHIPLTEVDPPVFRRETHRTRDLLQDITGQGVDGYRAPTMSLTPRSAWALDEIAEAGFTYSSSVLPGRAGLYSWPGVPDRPFRWSAGLVELPCPVGRFLGGTSPYLGGTYLRLLPRGTYRLALRRAGPEEILWTYCHPWEFDADEPRYRLAHAGWFTSRAAWVGRRNTTARITDVLSNGVAPPLVERIGELDQGTLPLVRPTHRI